MIENGQMDSSETQKIIAFNKLISPWSTKDSTVLEQFIFFRVKGGKKIKCNIETSRGRDATLGVILVNF